MTAETQNTIMEPRPIRHGQAHFAHTGRSYALELGGHLAFAVTILVCLLAFYQYVYVPHHNVAGPVLSAQLAKTLGDSFANYSSYFPPAEKAWFGLAVTLSDLSSISPDLVVVLMTGIAVLFSAALAYGIRKQTVGATPLFFVLSVVALIVLPILFRNLFGLRVHLVVLGLWPYLNLRLCDPDDTKIGWKLRAVVGLWLGAVLTLRYIFSIIVLVVELADATTGRRVMTLFRIENLIAGAIVALYLFFWLVIDPSQREVVGVMVSAIDANLTSRTGNMVHAAIQFSTAIFFVALTYVCKLPIRSMVIGLAMVVGAIAAAWIQSRWYSHHVLPITAAYVAWLWMIHREVKPLWVTAMALIVAQPIVKEFTAIAPYQQAVGELEQAMDEADLSVAGKRVGLLNMHPSPFNQYLAKNGGLRWIGAMNNAYVAAELKSLDRQEKVGETVPSLAFEEPGRQMLHDDMLRLWEDMPPDVLILDESTSWPLKNIEVRWTEVLADDARFQAIVSQYRPVMHHEGERLDFTYYERIE
ncbi:MAG: hypothetical protein ACX930_05205 [Erythrobacter sp.]